MLKLGRREILLGAVAVAALASACNGSASTGESPDDMVLGAEDAPVTLVEYASATCPHCADFHAEVWERLKTNYIDTGKVRFIFREYPTPPPQVALAAFQVARCNGASADDYFNRLSAVFTQQRAMFASGSMEGVRLKLVEIGASAGLSEEQVMGCIGDETGQARIRRNIEAGQRDGVTGTPTLLINSQKIEDPSALTYDGLSRLLDAAVAAGS